VKVAENDVLIADFEGDDYGEWEITGEAFGSRPAHGTLPYQNEVVGFLGNGLVNTFNNGDITQGILTSPLFEIQRPYINFLIGGGNHPSQTCINLLIDGEVVRTATGSNVEDLMWHTWNVTSFMNKKSRIQIVDKHSGGWGHINIDQIYQSSVDESGNRMICEPIYHFKPESGQRIGDPHPFYHKGSYHLFYQPGWCHAKSTNLIHWEYLPRAMEVSRALGEEHLFSGCVTLDGFSNPMIFYTSIGQGKTEKEYAWIWAARGDASLIKWNKLNNNPILDEEQHSVKIWDWRDPFVFKHNDHIFMVAGGHLTPAPEFGRATVELYRAENDSLTNWKYLGILFEDQNTASGNIECPFLFQDNGYWALGISTFRGVEYITGSLETNSGVFIPKYRGWIEASRKHFYAPSITMDDKGRCLMWGWIQGLKDWKGCLTIPRVLRISGNGQLIQKPAPELQRLRCKHYTKSNIQLTDSKQILKGIKGDSFEIIAEFKDVNAKYFGLNLLCSNDGERSVAIRCDDKELNVNGLKIALNKLNIDQIYKLHVFLDKSVLEVFVNDGRACITRVVGYGKDDLGVELFVESGDVTIKTLNVWKMKSI